MMFREELEQLINKHNMESGSDTPDFILARFLSACLVAFDKAILARFLFACLAALNEALSDPCDGDGKHQFLSACLAAFDEAVTPSNKGLEPTAPVDLISEDMTK